MKRELICIVCPRGCALSCEMGDEKNVISVSGNLCPRGKTYAVKECTNPERTVTSTVRCDDGSVVSCKTSKPIPKELMLEVMKKINTAVAVGEIRIGDVIIENVLGTGADIVATSDK